MKSSRKSQNC